MAKRPQDQTVSELLSSVETLQKRLKALESEKGKHTFVKGDIVQIMNDRTPTPLNLEEGFRKGVYCMIMSRSSVGSIWIALPGKKSLTNHCKASQLRIIFKAKDR